MSEQKVRHVSEEKAIEVAEAARQEEWLQPSFMKEMFLGRFRFDLIHPFPLALEERPEFTAFYNALVEFIGNEVFESVGFSQLCHIFAKFHF